MKRFGRIVGAGRHEAYSFLIVRRERATSDGNGEISANGLGWSATRGPLGVSTVPRALNVDSGGACADLSHVRRPGR